jgi:FkbM family methyltransferase
MTETKGLRLAAYEAKRVAQTCRTFSNWPALLAEMGGARVGRGTDELTFVTRRGLRLRCPNVPGARLPLYEQFADDCYDVAWLLGPERTAPLQAIDVGAHVGAFAAHLANRGPAVRVECYEPSPQSAKYLRANVEGNGLADRITVHECALAAEAGTALLDDNSAGSVHNGLVQAEHRLVDGTDALGSRGTIAVATSTFDDAVRAAPGPVDVVKMDCEGGEYGLVYASTPGNWASVQRVVMEYHPVAGESWTELRAWFEGVGLDVVRHTSDSPGLGTAWLARTGGGPR